MPQTAVSVPLPYSRKISGLAGPEPSVTTALVLARFRPASFVTALCLCHVQGKPGILCLVFGVEPVRPRLASAADPAPVARQAPVAEETPHDVEAIEAVQVGCRVDSGQMHVPYPHILAAMSCSSLPVASA